MQIVPTNKPVARDDSNDVVFRNTKGKWNAVTTEIVRMHKTGRPVLVGTTSVETSELVAQMLEEKGIKHEVCSFHAVEMKPKCARNRSMLCTACNSSTSSEFALAAQVVLNYGKVAIQ